MDMNLNYRVGYIAIRDTIVFAVIVLVYILLHILEFSEALEATVSMITNSLIRFHITDYFTLGSNHMTEANYQSLRQNSMQGNPQPEQPPFKKSSDVYLYDALGLSCIVSFDEFVPDFGRKFDLDGIIADSWSIRG